jgi:hypothetical protein
MGMKTLFGATGVAAIFAMAVLSSMGTAAAAPTGTESAAIVVQNLKAQGYNVMLNGAITDPLPECHVTGVHNPDASGRAIGFTTVYVDVTCPDV